MSKTDFWEFFTDFFGSGALSATAADNSEMLIADTSVAGTPTYVYVDGSQSGEVALDFDSQAEAQNVCLYQGDKLQFDIDEIVEVEIRIKQNQATIDSATSIAFGVTGDRNDAIDSIAQAAIFRLIGTNSVVVETDDGTTNNDDVATGKTLANAYKTFKISFAAGKSDVRFFIDGEPVAESTTFSMAAYSGSLQAFVQIQKTSDANTDGVTIDSIRIRGRRAH